MITLMMLYMHFFQDLLQSMNIKMDTYSGQFVQQYLVSR